MRILLVDDDDYVRSSVTECLTARGHEVRAYVTASESLAVMELFQPELVISDIQMPGMDGIELLSRIREKSMDLPVILMTSEQTVDTALKAWNRAYDYLNKPVRMKVLLACIEKIEGAGG
jgi:DNA-binding NtrC family response regulator